MGTASVSVPAGIYAISGDGLFFNRQAKPGAGECTLEAPGVSEARFGTVPNVGEEEPIEKTIEGSATIANSGVVELKTAGTITEKCLTGRESQVTVSLSSTRVTAILVGALN